MGGEFRRKTRFSLRLVSSEPPVKQSDGEVRCWRMELRLGVWVGDTNLEISSKNSTDGI